MSRETLLWVALFVMAAALGWVLAGPSCDCHKATGTVHDATA